MCQFIKMAFANLLINLSTFCFSCFGRGVETVCLCFCTDLSCLFRSPWRLVSFREPINSCNRTLLLSSGKDKNRYTCVSLCYALVFSLESAWFVYNDFSSIHLMFMPVKTKCLMAESDQYCDNIHISRVRQLRTK